jgi:catechol 2,3-dioxygenase-like lactoylglutathione lyase family enzyme
MEASTALVTGVDFACLPTRDFDAAREFYRSVLGLDERVQWGQMPAVEFQAGNLTVVVMDPTAFGQEFRTSSVPLAFRVDDVAAARTALEAQGVQFRGDIIDSGVCHQAIFNDPDGNVLILHHRYAPPSV